MASLRLTPRSLPLSLFAPHHHDLQLATDFVGLCRTDLRKYMGTVYSALETDEESSPVDCLGVSADPREALLPSGCSPALYYPSSHTLSLSLSPERAEPQQEIINEDGLDCLSNDAVEKQFPIHIAYRSSLVMTLAEGEDGVARLITRDLIGS